MHTQQRERERFARCPDPETAQFWGEGEENQKQQNTESTRRARGLPCRPLGRLAHAVAVGLAWYGADVYPAWGTLASRAGLTIPQAAAGMRELRGRRLVEVIPPGPDDDRVTNTYKLSPLLLAYLEEESAHQEERPPTAARNDRPDDQGGAAAGAASAQGEPAGGADPVDAPDAQDPPVGVQVPVVRVLEADLPGAAQPGGPAPAAAGCADGVARAAERGARPYGLTASIRDLLAKVADGAPVEVVTPAPRCPALLQDEDCCTGTWHEITGTRSVRRCGAVGKVAEPARKPAQESVQYKSTLARQVRTPEQHRSAATARRKVEGLYVAAGEIRVGRQRLADLDAIMERGRDATGAWTTVVGYLFPTRTAADVARRGAT